MDPEALLEGLDDAQRAAVTSTAQPLVVLAPAGSGKTRVLTRRIAHRVATGSADPRHVLALTFTRKAAGELDDRLRRLGLRGDTTTGTFHAVPGGPCALVGPTRAEHPSRCSIARVGCCGNWLLP
jgi:DNA helicase II / ATP-dependent DNA helicase PcrA